MEENEIQEIVDLANKGGEAPNGVKFLFINKKKKVYSYIYFDGLGVYKVDEMTPYRVLTNEEYLIQSGNGA